MPKRRDIAKDLEELQYKIAIDIEKNKMKRYAKIKDPFLREYQIISDQVNEIIVTLREFSYRDPMMEIILDCRKRLDEYGKQLKKDFKK